MAQEASYFVWGIDDSPYGPVALNELHNWIRLGRVVPNTWVFACGAGEWKRASHFPELQNQFGGIHEISDRLGLTPGLLRRVKILANLQDLQLAHLCDFIDVEEVPAYYNLFKQGDVGDAMYLVLAGELRARTVTNGVESILATFRAGDFFGDMALFDNGPRSADVVANMESSLLKISAGNFYRMIREAPALAAPFLQATVRTLSSRIRADNKRLSHLSEQFSASRGI